MDKSQSKSPCLLCGGTSFDWYWIDGINDRAVTLRSQKLGFWSVIRPRQEISARRCNNCGNILLFDAAFVDEN